MPELKRNFVKGRMNKDFDERILPSGEYFDATNIQVSTSENSDVGAVETLLGNTVQRTRSGGTWTDNFGLSTPTCIGAIRDTQNNKIYWFIVDSASKSAILEYDESNSRVAVVIADIRTGDNQVLGFNSNNLITGANIIDGLLFFTDNLNEPRRINISTFKTGSPAGPTINATTTLLSKKSGTQIAFTAEDINVIKKAPKQAPSLQLFSSLIGGGNIPGTGILPLITRPHNFHSSGYPVTGAQTINFVNNLDMHSVFVGKEVQLKASIPNAKGEKEKYIIKGVVTASSISSMTMTPLVIPENIPNKLVPWELLIEEDDFIYKREFPRFAYRWKYNDGEYSAISPFTQAAFLPGQYKYQSMDAENEAMLNHIRRIHLSFPLRETTYGPPRDVEYVEVLYKSSKSNNIYIIKSARLKAASISAISETPPFLNVRDDGEFTGMNITEELDGPVIDSSQLLRLFDAVPKKALAQEIIGNRIVYGNYTEGYDEPQDLPAFDISIEGRDTFEFGSATPQLFVGQPSLKSDKTYQIGVAYLDEFNRESPVLTNNSATLKVDKIFSNLATSIRVSVKSAAPSWAKFFKYYVKDNYSTEYNLQLDRFYDAEDGNIWLSFPSAERNKIEEKDILVLKKQHGKHIAVNSNNEYKVIDIKNDPPEALRINNLDIKARAGCTGTDGTVMGAVGGRTLVFRGPSKDLDEKFASEASTARAIQLLNPSTQTYAESKIYKVKSIGLTEDGHFSQYNVTLEEDIISADDFIADINAITETFTAVLYSEDDIFGMEFQGRFFVKVEKKSSFHNDVVSPSFTSDVTTYVAYQTPDSATESVQTITDPIAARLGLSPTNTVIQSFKKNATLPQTPLEIFVVHRTQRFIDPFTGQLKTYYVYRKRVIAQMSFRVHSDYTLSPTQDLLSNDNTFTLVYGPTDADIDTVSEVYNAIEAGTKIRFTSGETFSEIYTVASISGANNNSFGGKTFPAKTITIDRNYGVEIAVANIDGIQVLGVNHKDILVNNPAIFEIKPQKNLDLDIYYEASNAIEIAELNKPQDLTYNNCFSFGNGVESTRISDDFNAPALGKGVKVSSILKKAFKEETRQSDLIFSGIINSRTDVNNSNQFLIAEKITKSINPIHGSIQKLHARDTDLVVLCEDKCFKILANKDALFNADGNANLTASENVLGQVIPYIGEFGISQNPESFVSYGFRAYFADKSRGAVLRLSRDGLTKISDQGLSDFIEDSMAATTAALNGSYDESSGTYNLRIGSEQISYDENVKGWQSRLTYQPEFALSLNNNYYSFKEGEIWKHTNATRANFYGSQQTTTATVIFNDAPSTVKNFKTLSYEGDSGWTATAETDLQNGSVPSFVAKENKYYNYIHGVALTWTNASQTGTLDISEFSTQGLGTPSQVTDHGSTFEFTFANPLNVGLQIGDIAFCLEADGDIEKLGEVTSINTAANSFVCKDEFSASEPTTSEFIFFAKDNEVNVSGVIGYFNKVVFTNTGTGKNELFAINSEVFISSK